MERINGTYENGIIFAKTIEDAAREQVQAMLNSPIAENSHARFMPDMHAGAGCVIGTTMKITDKVCPNLVGVDIGCGMYGVFVGEKTDEEIEQLNKFCHEEIVSGRNVHSESSEDTAQTVMIARLRCRKALHDVEWIRCSNKTLGGGNHFIELDQGKDGCWLIVHTGSRNLGKQVAEYYQQKAVDTCYAGYEDERRAIIEQYKAEGRRSEIQKVLSSMKKPPIIGLEYLTGEDMEDYLHDMNLVQHWAKVNRHALINQILEGLDWEAVHEIETIHNYIDIENKILRKGAISAQKGEVCLIPLNMRDGTLICVGKGNEEWNYSAPHGAGRLMSRAQARQQISLESFQESMEGIVSSSVCEETIDESPFAYKNYQEIMEVIEPTVKIVERIIPVFNYKATEV